LKTLYKSSAPYILVQPGDYYARGFYRIHQPIKSASKLGSISSRISTSFLSDAELKALNPDVVIWHQSHMDNQILNIYRYRKVLPNAFFVYEMDDLIVNIPDWNPNKRGFQSDIERRLRSIFKIMDRVACSTQYLANSLRNYFKLGSVKVIPNYLLRDVVEGIEKYQESNPPTPSDKLRIGWAGGATHKGDLDQIKEVVQQTKDTYQWVFFGFLPEGINKEDVEFHPPVDFPQYFPKLASLNLDIAIAPLEINEFNKCKSNLRLLEYGACRFPVVASNIEPYKDLPCECVDNTTESWLNGIKKLEDKTYRDNLAISLHNKVISDFILEDNISGIVRSWSDSDRVCFNK